MTKFKIEIQITLLAIIIGTAVVTTGYFAYKSLSKIVDSIHQEAQPDNKLFLIKDIASDLTALEHRVKLYVLTDNNADLQVYYSLEDRIVQSLKKLNNLEKGNKNVAALIDTISKLSHEKLELWNEILNNHLSAEFFFPAFSEIYSNLQERKIDTTSMETDIKGISQKELGDEKGEKSGTFAERSLEKNKIRMKILNLEREIYKNRDQINIQESQLIEKNIIIGKKMNQLIAEAENRETNALIEKTNEADRLAAITYKRLAVFTIASVILLLIALFVLFNFLKKSRAYQRALNNAKQKAENLALAKEQFAANVSHELRTPVNAIYGLTEQALQKPLDSELRELLSILSKSAFHLKNIINDTLDFSKIQAQKIKFEAVDFSPPDIFEEVLALQKYEVTKKGISLNFVWEGDRPEALVGDPLRLKQILINLIGNAIKFTEKGEVGLKVKAEKNNNKYNLNMQVADTGIGMSEENLKIIFDEFVQIENQTGKKYSGTGLGLSIVKKLVELQGGNITVESEPGKGTKVNVDINYSEGDKNNIQINKWEAFMIPESFKQLSVLVADDEEFNRFLLNGILKKWGIKFIEVKNGNEAVSATFDEKFDVILMDLHMPEVNGIEAAKTILRKIPDAIIIAVSASNEPVDWQACKNAGMKGFLLKPFSEKDLFDTLISVIPAEKDKIPANLSQEINMAELSRLANGDKKFLREMILLFIKSMETGIANIEEAIRNENWNSIFENAHKMAAPSKQIGATNLYNNIKKLERMAQQNVIIESIFPVFQGIKNEITELNTFLKSHLNEID